MNVMLFALGLVCKCVTKYVNLSMVAVFYSAR